MPINIGTPLTLVMGPRKTHTKWFWGQIWPQGCFLEFAYKKIVRWIFEDLQQCRIALTD